MLKSAFQLGEEISLRTLPYKLNKSLWYSFKIDYLDFEKRRKMKYLNSNGYE
jgi:hypothetical protein